MRVLLHKLRRFAGFPLQQKAWFFIAYFLLGACRLVILIVPFRHFAPCLGKHYGREALSLCVPDEQQLKARDIGRMIRSAANHTPWESKCLAQAMVARLFLAYYKLPYLFYFGLAKDGEGGMKAHAWVCCGRMLVTGGRSFGQFTIVSTFSSEDLDLTPSC